MDITVGRSLDLPGRFGDGWTVINEDPHGGVILTRPLLDTFETITISKKGYDMMEHWKDNDKNTHPPTLNFALNETLAIAPDIQAKILALDGRSDVQTKDGKAKGSYLVEVALPNGEKKREWVDAKIVNSLSAIRQNDAPDDTRLTPLKSALGILPEEEKKPGLKGKFETKDKAGNVTAVTKVKDGVAETRDRHGKVIARTIIGKNELTSIGEKRESLGNMVFKQPVGMEQLQAHVLTITGKVMVPAAIPTAAETITDTTTTTTFTGEVTSEAEGAAAEAQMAAMPDQGDQNASAVIRFLRDQNQDRTAGASDLPLTRGIEGVPNKSEAARPNVGGGGSGGGAGRGEPPQSPLSGGGLTVAAVGSVGQAEGTTEGAAEPTNVETTTTTTTTTSKPNLELTGDRQALTEERDQLMAQIQKQNNTIASATGRLQMLQREPPSEKRDQMIAQTNNERKRALGEKTLKLQTKLTEVQFFLDGMGPENAAHPTDLRRGERRSPSSQTVVPEPRKVPMDVAGIPLRTRKQPAQILKGSNPVRPPQPILPARQASEPVERGQRGETEGLSDSSVSPQSSKPLPTYTAQRTPAMSLPGEAPPTVGEREAESRQIAQQQIATKESLQRPQEPEAPSEQTEESVEPGAPAPRRAAGQEEPSEEPTEEEPWEDEQERQWAAQVASERAADASGGLPAGLQPGVMGGPPGLGGGIGDLGGAADKAKKAAKWAKRLSIAWPFIAAVAPILLGIAATILFVVLIAAIISPSGSTP